MRCFYYGALFAFALPASAGLVVTNFIVLCNTSPACPTIASQSTTMNYSNTITNGPNSITITGFADEDLTTLALKASGTESETSQETFYNGLGIVAQLSDTFTINAPGLNGTVGYLEMPFSGTGTVSGTGRGGIEVILQDSVGGSTGSCNQNVSLCLFAGNFSFLAGSPATGLLSFHYGSPFTLIWGLSPTFFPQQGLSGTSDYSHTLTLQGFEVFNSNQQQVYNATIMGTGGEQIALLAPEPELTIPLMLSLVSIGLAKVSLRKKSASS